jgi:hypothetical protein
MSRSKPQQSAETKADWVAALDEAILNPGSSPDIPPPPPPAPKPRRYKRRDPAEDIAQKLTEGLGPDHTLGGHRWQ